MDTLEAVATYTDPRSRKNSRSREANIGQGTSQPSNTTVFHSPGAVFIGITSLVPILCNDLRLTAFLVVDQ